MDPQAVLDTLKHHRAELEVGYEISKRRTLGYAASSYHGEISGIDYAIEVLEAAMGTPTGERSIVWHYPSKTGNPAYETITVLPDVSSTFDQACQVTAGLQAEYPEYTITLVES